MMKFNYNLSDRENMRRWFEHYASVPHTRKDELDAAEISTLLKLNESLRQLEIKYFAVLEAKLSELQARVENCSDWMVEFNLDYLITFYLREDDPEYEEADDNILMRINGSHSDPGRRELDWGFGATHIDHALSMTHLSGEQHCYTFHQLYDHCSLDWRDLLRIGYVYFDLKIDEQSGMLPV